MAIMVRGQSYVRDDGWRCTFQKIVDGKVECYQEGGGFLHHIPLDVWCEQFSVAIPANQLLWRAGTVGFDGTEEDEGFPCFLTGRKWNGWDIPAFERETIPLLFEDQDYYRTRWEGDKFIIECDDSEEPEVCEPFTINVDGVEKRVWTVGDGWCWSATE